MFFFLTQYLQDVLKFTPLATGFAFLPMAAAMFGMTRLVPRLLARLGAKTMAVTGSVLMIGGLVWLTQVGEHSGYAAGLLGPMVLIGLGGGLGFAPLNVLIMATVPVANAGSAGGALQTVQQIGGTLGLAVLVTVSGAAVRGVTGTPAHVLVTGMTSAFVVSACFAAITLAVALTLPRRQTR
jgi:Na+/melibiose symporter-like transporter